MSEAKPAAKTAEPVQTTNGGQTAAATAAPMVKAGQVARQEFGATQIAVSAETAGTALAARERAMVEARFIIAKRFPRDWDDVRQKLLRACERPGFAGSANEKVWGAAWYRKPVGEGVEGFSVRFAEEALRCMGNIDVNNAIVFDDERTRIVNVTVLDFESNNSPTTAVMLDKTVERRFLKKGEEAIRVRTNSKGEPTYLLPATDDDVFSKQQNLCAKARRTGILQLLPGDIQAACRARILEIRQGDIAKDPDKARRDISDGFGKLNVMPSHLKEYLGHDLATATPAELADLRDLWTELKEGKVTWAEVMAEVSDERDGTKAAAAAVPKSGLEDLTDKLKAQAAPPAAAQAQPPPAAQESAPQPPAAATTTPEPTPEPPKGPFGKAVEAERKRTGQRTLEE